MEQHIQTASFVEMIIVNPTQVSNPDFDIILDEKVTLQNYCNALIEIIFTLKLTQYPTFINYQTNLVNNPIAWLNKLEKLLANNEELFVSKKVLCRYNKLFNLIEKKQTELQSSSIKETKINTPKKYINAESEDRYFSFYEIKKQLEKINNDNQKILLLTKEMFEYQQANIEFINQKTPFYDAQCTKEIENIYALQKIQAAIEEAQKLKLSSPNPNKKLKFNGNLNQLVDMFYQLNRELFIDGKPYIDENTNDLADWIVNSFLDKEGKEISPLTVKTILKPSKEDKRPNTHKRLDIDKLL